MRRTEKTSFFELLMKLTGAVRLSSHFTRLHSSSLDPSDKSKQIPVAQAMHGETYGEIVKKRQLVFCKATSFPGP